MHRTIKKFLIVPALMLCFAAVFAAKAFAADVEEVKKFFNSFTSALNSYSADVPDYFTNDAKIYRVVIKKDGTKESVQVPFDRYVSELNKGKIGAKLVGYTNRFENISVTKSDAKNFKLTAKRFPMDDTKGTDVTYVITDTGNGLKIKSESWDTTVQKFLNEK